MNDADGILNDFKEYHLDYLFIKFSGVKTPLIIPWIEVADGTYVAEESTEDEIVILTKKKKKDTDDNTAPAANEGDLVKSHLKKEALMAYLETKLRDPNLLNIVDYGTIEDLRLQPAGREMTSSVYKFLLNYGVA